MLLKDDDNDLPSQSSAEYVTRADHGKAERREKAAKEKGKLLALKRELLRGQVNAAKTPDEAPQEEEAANVSDDEAQAREDPSGTLTAAQQEDLQVQDADEKDTPETLRNKAAQQRQAKKQEGEEYQQNMS